MEIINCSQKNLDDVEVKAGNLELNGKEARIIQLVDELGNPYSWSKIAQGLLEDSQFRGFWNKTLAEIPFDFQWKPIPIYPEFTKNYPFFAVLVPSCFPPSNPSAYHQYLHQLSHQQLTIMFPNLSGDALLLIPKDTGDYGHIAAFCRNADDDLVQTLWKEVGKITYQAIINEQIMWCNTHGHGVPWMHIRFDQTLKYAAFSPYGHINKTSQTQWYEKIYLKAFGR